MTKQDISNLLNVGLTTYRRWETGERTIPTNYLIILSSYYKVSVDYILGLTDESAPRTPSKNIKNNIEINFGNVNMN